MFQFTGECMTTEFVKVMTKVTKKNLLYVEHNETHLESNLLS